MTEADLYDNVVSSLEKVVNDFRKEHMPDAEYVNWDAHAQLTELPQADCVGLAGVGLSEDDPKSYEIALGVAVSTWDDPGLYRLRKLMSKLRACFIPETRIQVYDHETAEPNCFMVCVVPLGIMPVGKAETRSVQAMEVRLLLDPGAASSLR